MATDVLHLCFRPPYFWGSYNRTVLRIVEADLGLRQHAVCYGVAGPPASGWRHPSFTLVPAGSTPRWLPRLHRVTRLNGIERFAVPRDPDRYRYQRAAIGLATTMQPRVVVVWDDVRLALGLATSRHRPERVLFFQHGSRYGLPEQIRQAFYGSDLLDGLIFLSRKAQEDAAQSVTKLVPSFVYPNGVDTVRFSPATPGRRSEARRALGLPGDARVALFVSRLVPVKGAHLILDAWKGIHAAVPGSRLLLVGSGHDAYVQQLRANLRQTVRSSVIFNGGLDPDQMARAYDAADVFVFPTLAPEGMPLVVLEAMASGLPVVTHDFVARAEVGDETHGLVTTELECVPELARHVTELLLDDDRRRRLGAAARRRVESAFSLETTLDSMGALYRSYSSHATCSSPTP